MWCFPGRSCGHPGNIPNGNVAGGFFFMDNVTYTCHSGYEMIHTENQLKQCQFDTGSSNMTWMPAAYPKCISMEIISSNSIINEEKI